jgi:hypothetical protein
VLVVPAEFGLPQHVLTGIVDLSDLVSCFNCLGREDSLEGVSLIRGIESSRHPDGEAVNNLQAEVFADNCGVVKLWSQRFLRRVHWNLQGVKKQSSMGARSQCPDRGSGVGCENLSSWIWTRIRRGKWRVFWANSGGSSV